MKNELQMIPTNTELDSRGVEVGPTQCRRHGNRRDEPAVTKKAALELDAAFVTRRALGSWAAVEIAAESENEMPPPSKNRPATLPRPNSSFLHSLIVPRPIETSKEVHSEKPRPTQENEESSAANDTPCGKPKGIPSSLAFAESDAKESLRVEAVEKSPSEERSPLPDPQQFIDERRKESKEIIPERSLSVTDAVKSISVANVVKPPIEERRKEAKEIIQERSLSLGNIVKSHIDERKKESKEVITERSLSVTNAVKPISAPNVVKNPIHEKRKESKEILPERSISVSNVAKPPVEEKRKASKEIPERPLTNIEQPSVYDRRKECREASVNSFSVTRPSVDERRSEPKEIPEHHFSAANVEGEKKKSFRRVVEASGSEGDGEEEEEEEGRTPVIRSPSPSRRSLRSPPLLASLPVASPKKPSFRVVRRRDSRRKEARRHHVMAVLPGTKVATLASKFNALILEKEGSPAQQKVAARLQRTLSAQKSVAPRRRGACAPGEADGRRQWNRKRGEVEGGNSRRADPEGTKKVLTPGVVHVAAKTAVTSVKDAIRIFEGNSPRAGPPIPRKPKRDSIADGQVVNTDNEERGHSRESNETSSVETPANVCLVSEAEDDGITVERSEVRVILTRALPVQLEEDEEEEDEGYELVVPKYPPKVAPKPNESFLWGTLPRPSVPSYLVQQEKPVFIPTVYSPQDEDCYDDVGPPTEPIRSAEECEGDGNYETFDIGKDSGLLGGEEGKVEEHNEEGVRKDDGLDDDDESAYDDVSSLAALAEARAETASVSNCYESIYCVGREGSDEDRRHRGTEVQFAVDCGSVSGEDSRGGSSVASSDSLSGIELKSNSLYGRCGSALSDDRESEGDGPHEVLSYQLTSLGAASVKGSGECERRSDTSDEWVDLEASDEEDRDEDQDEDQDSEGAVLVFRERLSRGRRSPKWSKRVRREWSSRSKKSREVLDMEGEQHHYETLYELVGGMVPKEQQQKTCTILVEEKSVTPNPPLERKHALPYENLSDDDDFDSFDSDDTEEFDDQVPTKELPSIPIELSKIPQSHGPALPGVNTNGITKKMAEVAGKKMQAFRKNWTLRKHDLSRSLQRIRKKSGGDVPISGMPTHPQPPLPPTPDSAPALPPPRTVNRIPSTPNLPPSIPSVPTAPVRQTSFPFIDSKPLNKSVSSGSLTGRKYWSFKSRFGRRESASTTSLQRQSLCNSSPSTSPSSSTFYLTETVDVDTGLTETVGSVTKSQPTEYLTENQLNYCVSGEEVVKRTKNTREKQKNTSSKPPVTRRLSIRPQGPPPPPPNCPNATHNIAQNGDAKTNAMSSSLSSCPTVTYAPPSSTSSSSSASSHYVLHCKDNRVSPTTSWYTDTDIGTERPESLDENLRKEIRGSNSSWYADIGLWTTKNLQNTHDNGRNTDTSDSSSSAVASPEGSLVHGQFTDEPLYQFYTASVAEKVTRDISQDFDSDGYEEIREFKTEKQPSPRPKAMDLVRHKEGCRTLWCQIPEVLGSGLLDTFNSHQRKIQEAKFEVVTSEASYLKSLNILVKQFMESPVLKDENLLSKSDREVLFSNVLPVKHCSEKFMADLDRCWLEDILLLDICEIIRRHAEKYFGVYVSYCSNQVHLDRALHRLKKSPKFLEAVASLESHPVCQSLTLHSFLMLPMQRITRLPLLVDAILRRMPNDDSKYGACQVALATLNKVVHECNEGARHAERLEEMKVLSKQLDFREVRMPPLLSDGRWLVRKGELTHLYWRDDSSSLLGVASATATSSVSSIANTPVVPSPSISASKLTFGRKMMKQTLFLFLFNDLLVITKKKGDEHFSVLDFCPRNLVEIIASGLDGFGGASSLQQLPPKYVSEGGKNIFLLSMLQNHDNRTVEMVLSSSQESEKERWLEAFTPASSENPDEQVYEVWDCPQVASIHHYIAQQPDELSLEQSDIVNVLRKLPDGWYLGERIRDGERGWFPANHCKEIASSHMRAKNLRQRYRLLALSGDYLEQQRRERQLEKAAKKKKKLKKESKKE